ncbi:CCA tRNA nucleotidyltransferase [Candidatus Bealeia paramacronuclearis]|uniref:CCA tRNA nucleotidyltransferase n=1 Tax=Candidatus Bealeia paramacronuclearis TaxID=1921001 RepID=UPI0030CF09FC
MKTLFQTLSQNGATPYLVGGGVRDALLGLRAEDEDIAINILPEEVMGLLDEAGIPHVPTGLSHGTITAVLKKRPYQITSLRTDIKTFGRHAEVAFTEDWIQDASRRDFTINALYADLEGTIYDPFGGIEDLHNHHVKFIGNPTKRIEEDYLRILRFFRFSAFYGKGNLDSEGLAACTRLAPQIRILAKERITQEFLKLMKTPFVFPVLKTLQGSRILGVFLETTIDFEGLQKMLEFERSLSFGPDPFLRLALSQIQSTVLFSSLRLSNKEQLRYKKLENFQPITAQNLSESLYRWGTETVRDWVILQASKGGEFDSSWLQIIQSWTRPLFPLKGEDLMQRGIKGPALGNILHETEEWWISENFKPSYEACLNRLDQVLEKGNREPV